MSIRTKDDLDKLFKKPDVADDIKRDVDIRRADADDFAKLVSTLIVSLDVLPPDWQQRALDILKAAYPDNRDRPQPPPVNTYDLTRYGGQISGTLK